MSERSASWQFELSDDEQVAAAALAGRRRALLNQVLAMGTALWAFVGLGALLGGSALGAAVGALLGAAVAAGAARKLRPIAAARRSLRRGAVAGREWTLRLWADHVEVEAAHGSCTVDRRRLRWTATQGLWARGSSDTGELLLVVPARVLSLERLQGRPDGLPPLPPAQLDEHVLRWSHGEPEIQALIDAGAGRFPAMRWLAAAGVAVGLVGGPLAVAAGTPWRVAGCALVGALLVVVGTAGAWSEVLWRRALRREAGPRQVGLGPGGLSIERDGRRDVTAWDRVVVVARTPSHLVLGVAGSGRIAIPISGESAADVLLERLT
ncbi:MAG: hypothetical protein H6742_07210 [Alphaproteobacteria bacterium]|nr:hypothetical protein [Alphaproteobacteria bacterium]